MLIVISRLPVLYEKLAAEKLGGPSKAFASFEKA